MMYTFFKSKDSILKAYGGMFLLVAALFWQVSLSVSINEWYGGFYNILQKATEHTIEEFWEQMYMFAELAFPYVLIATASAYFSRVWAFWWRTKITFDSLELFKSSPNMVEGSSQRIQEDAYRFAKIVENLGLQVIRALMTLIAFIPLLYGLSENAIVPYMEDVDGSLVYVAVIVSIGGLILSWFIGYYLPKIEYDIQKSEASFRKELVYAEDDRENFAKPETIVELFTGLKVNYRKLFLHYGYFDVWVNFFEQLMIIVPYLIMAPALFSGAILLGVLVQVSNAFSKVRESFSVFISNWTTITELRSIHKRLKEFEIELKKV
jgi:peptide/bleomycin uptake transporter